MSISTQTVIKEKWKRLSDNCAQTSTTMEDIDDMEVM